MSSVGDGVVGVVTGGRTTSDGELVVRVLSVGVGLVVEVLDDVVGVGVPGVAALTPAPTVDDGVSLSEAEDAATVIP
ncbi:MAG: hypothetical protein HOV83_19910, partial [Catenulispora sp.]|nr:hypothetical protein [Catenulispora sp.]